MTNLIADNANREDHDAEVKSIPRKQETSVTMVSSDSEGDDDTRTDEELIAEGTRLCKDDRVTEGIALLNKVKDKALFTSEHKEFIIRGEHIAKLYETLGAPASEGWTKQGESHGHRDFVVYYKVEDGNKLKCRIESVIEASLYVPLLAVCNEVDLYNEWFPRWRFPRLGLQRSTTLKQTGRAEQVAQLTLDMPFPVQDREIILWAFVDDNSEGDCKVAIKLLTIDENDADGVVPPVESGVTRIEVTGDFLFRPCPDDHPILKHSKGEYPEGERKILITFVCYADPKISFIPQSILNFCTRTAIGTIWKMLLNIAEDVRDGKRPAHAECIVQKREALYDWVEKRSTIISGMQSPIHINEDDKTEG